MVTIYIFSCRMGLKSACSHCSSQIRESIRLRLNSGFFFTPVGAQACLFKPLFELEETWGVKGTDYLHQRTLVMKSTRISTDLHLLSVDSTSREKPPLVSTVKSSPPLGWNPFWHASNFLDPGKYGYTPSSAMLVNLVYCLHPVACSVI